MKGTFLYTIIGIVLPLVTYAQSIEEAGRVYVDSSQITFVGREIFVHIEGEWISVNAVYSDLLGMYIVGAKYPNSRWICRAPGCYYNNSGSDDTCQREDLKTGKKCGAPRPPG